MGLLERGPKAPNEGSRQAAQSESKNSTKEGAMVSAHNVPKKAAAQKKVPAPVEHHARRTVLGLVDEALRMTEKVALRIVQLSRTMRRKLHTPTSGPAKRVARRAA
jgi:hypothetical protein